MVSQRLFSAITAAAVVGVHPPIPGVGIGGPLLDRVAEHRDDLRARVADDVAVVAPRPRVGDGGDLLDERAELRLGLRPRLPPRARSSVASRSVTTRNRSGPSIAPRCTSTGTLAAVGLAAERLERGSRLPVGHVERDEQLDGLADQLDAT